MISMEKYYEYIKRIQKMYDDSVAGTAKGMIYNELTEIKLDYDFISNTSVNMEKRTVTFEIISKEGQKYVDDILIPRIKETIKRFVMKNIYDEKDKMFLFLLDSDYYFELYRINDKNDTCIVTVQL